MKNILILFHLGALGLFVCSCTTDFHKQAETKPTPPVEPVYRFIPVGSTKLTGGILADRCQKNIENLYLQIDVEALKQVFREKHQSWYAEPEFVGHYLAAGPLLYQACESRELMDNNLVLAIDSRYGTPIESTRILLQEKSELLKLAIEENGWVPQVKFGIKGMINERETLVTLVDYASAGSIQPGDKFRGWLPVYKN